jgi:putative transposase
VDPDHATISVRRQCDLLGVNRASLYYKPLGESEENLRLMRLIDEQYTKTPFFGSRRIEAWLRERQQLVVNRKRVSRLMEVMGLEAVYPKPKLSQPGEGHRIYPYLLRDVKVERVNQVWSTDITYIRMRQGFCYVVAVMDWHSRFVLSWSLSVTMELDFCVEALSSALRRARPEIFNSDQGSQFTSEKFIGELKARAITISMDGRGRCFDNIFIERLWRSLKYEEVVCCERLVCEDRTMLYRRWRMTLRSRPAGAGSKPPQAAGVKSPGGERCGKGGSNSVRCVSRRRT